MFVARHFERACGGVRQAIPEERIMPKHFKNVAIKAFAVACAGGLSLNGFALAIGASATRAKSSRTSAVVLPARPDPLPTPARPGISPAKDKMSAPSKERRRDCPVGFFGGT